MHKIAWLRNHVHAMHHEHTSPMFSWAAGWVHPVEIALAIVCEMAFPVLYKVHPLSLWFFIATWVFWLCEEHSGDHVWWSLWNMLPFGVGGGSVPHDIHHAPHTTRNFSFVFVVWDKLFGTFEEPEGEDWKRRWARMDKNTHAVKNQE